jgi:putative restriction endonuclease
MLQVGLTDYQRKLTRLVVNRSGGRTSPHKICMLLAVLDLARAGALKQNRIFFAPPLLERYNTLFATVRAAGDHPNPYFPFLHLAGRLRGGDGSFWHLSPIPGREAVLAAMSTARSSTDITANIAFAELDQELFALLQDPASIEALAETIATHWLDRGLKELRVVAALSSQSSVYERKLRSGEAPGVTEHPPPEYVRSPAFRRLVTEVYDYRCAATGVRILLSTGEAMVEAAHIHPFAEAGDDDPRNGLALTPDMHWAMDRFLIAPGPDLRWHVSEALDDRVPDYDRFAALRGRGLLLPPEKRYAPKETALAWRLERLRRAT